MAIIGLKTEEKQETAFDLNPVDVLNPLKRGPGRPVGSKTKRLLIIDHLAPAEQKKLIRKAYNMAIRGDKTLLMYLLDHLAGKPRQALEIEEIEDKTINLITDDQARKIAKQFLTTTKPKK